MFYNVSIDGAYRTLHSLPSFIMTYSNLKNKNKSLEINLEGVETDKKGMEYMLQTCQINGFNIQARLYTQNTYFAALCPMPNGEMCRFVLDLKVSVLDYMKDPETFFMSAFQMARQKAWWVDSSEDEISYDRYGTPYYEEIYDIGEVFYASPGQIKSIQVRFRYYPKKVVPQLIFHRAPMELSNGTMWEGKDSTLMDGIYRDRFVLNQVIGNIRKSLRAKGYELNYS